MLNWVSEVKLEMYTALLVLVTPHVRLISLWSTDRVWFVNRFEVNWNRKTRGGKKIMVKSTPKLSDKFISSQSYIIKTDMLARLRTFDVPRETTLKCTHKESTQMNTFSSQSRLYYCWLLSDFASITCLEGIINCVNPTYQSLLHYKSKAAAIPINTRDLRRPKGFHLLAHLSKWRLQVIHGIQSLGSNS